MADGDLDIDSSDTEPELCLPFQRLPIAMPASKRSVDGKVQLKLDFKAAVQKARPASSKRPSADVKDEEGKRRKVGVVDMVASVGPTRSLPDPGPLHPLLGTSEFARDIARQIQDRGFAVLRGVLRP